MIRSCFRVLTAAALLAPWATPAAAQRTVTGAQPLTFGNLIPGVRATVRPTDASRTGRIDIAGAANGQAIVFFNLPASLAGPAGATLPVSFAAGDAGFAGDQAIGSQIAFDPRNVYVGRIGNRGVSSIFLGGTATPAAGQRTGTYSAVVTLTVVFLP